jgi:hypothetical protein
VTPKEVAFDAPDDTAAIAQWVDRAQAEAEQITLDDWNRLWSGWADVEPDEMKDVIAGLSDGELVRMRDALADDSKEPWGARVVVGKLRGFLREEVFQRVRREHWA